MGIMLQYFDNTNGELCCMFYNLEHIINADAVSIYLQRDSGPICYTNFVGMESDG